MIDIFQHVLHAKYARFIHEDPTKPNNPKMVDLQPLVMFYVNWWQILINLAFYEGNGKNWSPNLIAKNFTGWRIDNSLYSCHDFAGFQQNESLYRKKRISSNYSRGQYKVR